MSSLIAQVPETFVDDATKQARVVRTQISPAEAVMSINVQERTVQVLRTLSPREEEIIRMRFGIEDGSEHTLEEVGRAFSVTRERIRQIEAKALRKLRHPSRCGELSHFSMTHVNKEAGRVHNHASNGGR
ncbi:MAG TPA: sigma-70 family RNA polymerase sigma factor [Candidatus Sulfotelmatobacter sp.]|nr:sigma-70 family RNA polymerase sigma factor [Candidatus Sulfotelmatobacter sp.]